MSESTATTGIGRYATSRIPVAGPDDTAGAVREGLVGGEYDSVESVVVLSGRKPVGLLPTRTLFAAPGAATLGDLMDPAPATTGADAGCEPAAARMAAEGLDGLVVIGPEGRFEGLVPATRMLAVLLSEHDEDMARLGGYLIGSKRARRAATESVAQRLRHRLPWLIVGLVGAMGSALIVGAFEAKLDAVILLAFFLPAVVYMADAVGTQTETVLIRAFAAGVTAKEVVVREIVTGLLAGVAVGAAFFPFALVGWGDADVALAVSLALVASCSIATAVAMLLPSVFQRLGVDPAFGSGPIATIIQDLLSISVYLAIATPIAT